MALLCPVSSLNLLYVSKELPHLILGQQKEYVQFLEEVKYVGQIWRPCKCRHNHEITGRVRQSETYIQFAIPLRPN